MLTADGGTAEAAADARRQHSDQLGGVAHLQQLLQVNTTVGELLELSALLQRSELLISDNGGLQERSDSQIPQQAEEVEREPLGANTDQVQETRADCVLRYIYVACLSCQALVRLKQPPPRQLGKSKAMHIMSTDDARAH